tara:strand:+ start:1743 stop:2798 length:1056 start_codon:yes stop_codon:yes gene_type:complete
VERYATVILFLLLSTSVLGKTIGEVTYLKGDGMLSRLKEEYELAEKLGVESNDLIETARGLTSITFEDNTQVRIKENSKLVIDDFVYDTKPKSVNRLALRVAIGTVRYASGGIAKNNAKDVDIQTPVATIAVRGTEFSMVVNEIGGSTVILLPNFDGTVGEIEVITLAGSVVMNQPFMATHVDSANSMPTRPVVLDITEDLISNQLIVSTPPELIAAEEDIQTAVDNILDTDFLEFKELEINQLDEDELEFSALDINLLDLDYLINLLDQVQLVADAFVVETVERIGFDEKTQTFGIVDRNEGTQTIQRFVGGDISITYPLGLAPSININQYGQEAILKLGNDNEFYIEQN